MPLNKATETDKECLSEISVASRGNIVSFFSSLVTEIICKKEDKLSLWILIEKMADKRNSEKEKIFF